MLISLAVKDLSTDSGNIYGTQSMFLFRNAELVLEWNGRSTWQIVETREKIKVSRATIYIITMEANTNVNVLHKTYERTQKFIFPTCEITSRVNKFKTD